MKYNFDNYDVNNIYKNICYYIGYQKDSHRSLSDWKNRKLMILTFAKFIVN